MDPANFSRLKLEKNKEKLVDYVFNLYKIKIGEPATAETPRGASKRRRLNEDDDVSGSSTLTTQHETETETTTTKDNDDMLDELMDELGVVEDNDKEITEDELHE